MLSIPLARRDHSDANDVPVIQHNGGCNASKLHHLVVALLSPMEPVCVQCGFRKVPPRRQDAGAVAAERPAPYRGLYIATH